MREFMLVFLGMVTLLFVGCGGGSDATSVSYDDPKVIENQDFYRVKLAELGDFYIKERFDENNNTLYEGKYFETDGSLVPDTNLTTPYSTDLLYVRIEDDPEIRCRVIDRGLSVEFWCLEYDLGILNLDTIRWKRLDDARLNPEE